MDLHRWTGAALDWYQQWAEGFGPVEAHPALQVSEERFTEAFTELSRRLGDSYPFFHPRYAGQMLKPAHPAAVAGYLATMLINPNNHALDGGPASSYLEQEVMAQIAGMYGMDPYLGHLTSSGTVANLEALYVARESHPGLGVAYSTASHYTHARMCGLLGVAGHAVSVDAAGRLDLAELERLLATEPIGTVVLTAGTTALGAVDPIHSALALRERYGVRLHVDAAYGGFFRLIADGDPDGVDPAPWLAIGECDSVVVDPHKHGLQPYGCGAVLFADPSVGRFYRHDSPYTYFTSSDLHLGEISLECSRSGAAAAALWLTLRLFPLTAEGLGAILRPGRRAALRFTEILAGSARLTPFQRPELDIVAYYPTCEPPALSSIDRRTEAIVQDGMSDAEDPVFLAACTVTAQELAARGHRVRADREQARVLRSVLMKPEHEYRAQWLAERVERLAALIEAAPR